MLFLDAIDLRFDDWMTLVTTVIGLPTAIQGIREIRHRNRHKQADVAKDILKEIFNSEKSKAAMQMLDWSGRKYNDGTMEHQIYFENFKSALRVTNLEFDEKEMYIRDCFEDLFDKLELIQNYVAIDFININDVAIPLAYYARIIKNKLNDFDAFLTSYGYEGAKQFILDIAVLQSKKCKRNITFLGLLNK